MKLSDREESGIVILEPKGKIMGGPDASLLHDKLYEYIDQDKKQIVVDLAQVDWMNSTGLGILISSYTTLRNHDGMLKLAVASPPVDGKANNEVIAFLADFFNVEKSDVSIISGERSRRKICLLGSLEEEDIRERLRPFL